MEGREGRRIIREYLIAELGQYGYSVSNWRDGPSIYIRLNTISWDPNPMQQLAREYQREPDNIKLALSGSWICYCGSDGMCKIASIANQQCALLVSHFIKELHLSLLTLRKNAMVEGIRLINEEISRLDSI